VVDVTAIILAAGSSRRMGRPKLLLTWGGTTVLGKTVETVAEAGILDILIVTGGESDQVLAEAERLGKHLPVRSIRNPDFQDGGMLSTLQAGLRSLEQSHTHSHKVGETPKEAAALIALGDQPQMLVTTVRQVVRAFDRGRAPLVVPSFANRRGHPWLIRSDLWISILELAAPATARDFLDRHRDEIEYVDAKTSSVLADIDTPQDYERERPK
jgi:molybdenum cofactor cytidylyltransferase